MSFMNKIKSSHCLLDGLVPRVTVAKYEYQPLFFSLKKEL